MKTQWKQYETEIDCNYTKFLSLKNKMDKQDPDKDDFIIMNVSFNFTKSIAKIKFREKIYENTKTKRTKRR